MTDISTNSKEDNLEATAKVRMLKTSPQKLNLVSRMIRNKPVNIALAQLKFSKKRIAKDVRKCLESAVANAENNHDLDIDELVVSEAYVGKNLVLKRGRPRARGRYGKILKPFSQLTIKVKQILANSEEKEKA
jgi:large subunit ribosomal protein L22|tara:strand:- start:2013 stop:2411 length:399 start_codon:yes stop_codon:yes gene_type:complete